ncbi:MOSC domain-containing protein [Altericroceibacterium endophyticum]|uniref:MOSC domain-containing protein n=1 Tax=Altericroceibacterium endophyticum TaxID=1808508 RepID=A0A6I4T3C5_9SPHN|nr:MOSC domain-containing protein [Altericroceibacterium endophyticum]MXO64661.1 MOSC domain-containing protein [Altericroceibacterium endophyticum]
MPQQTGILSGIARHDQPRGEIEVVATATSVTPAAGIEGDYRGSLKPGANKRQISLIEAESWDAAIQHIGVDLPWWIRRANLLVQGLRFPREEGTIIAIGDNCRLQVTMECNPCPRMDEIAPGLLDALKPDWRGGLLARVIAGGIIAPGDKIRIEQ